QFNGEAPVEGRLDVLAAKDSVDFSFSQKLTLRPGRNSIKVWAQHPTDSYPGNDTLTEQVIYNQPLVRQFPYKEGFESNDGFWYAQGVHSSWDWGQPQSENLKQ